MQWQLNLPACVLRGAASTAACQVIRRRHPPWCTTQQKAAPVGWSQQRVHLQTIKAGAVATLHGLPALTNWSSCHTPETPACSAPAKHPPNTTTLLYKRGKFLQGGAVERLAVINPEQGWAGPAVAAARTSPALVSCKLCCRALRQSPQCKTSQNCGTYAVQCLQANVMSVASIWLEDFEFGLKTLSYTEARTTSTQHSCAAACWALMGSVSTQNRWTRKQIDGRECPGTGAVPQRCRHSQRARSTGPALRRACYHSDSAVLASRTARAVDSRCCRCSPNKHNTYQAGFLFTTPNHTTNAPHHSVYTVSVPHQVSQGRPTPGAVQQPKLGPAE